MKNKYLILAFFALVWSFSLTNDLQAAVCADKDGQLGICVDLAKEKCPEGTAPSKKEHNCASGNSCCVEKNTTSTNTTTTKTTTTTESNKCVVNGGVCSNAKDSCKNGSLSNYNSFCDSNEICCKNTTSSSTTTATNSSKIANSSSDDDKTSSSSGNAWNEGLEKAGNFGLPEGTVDSVGKDLIEWILIIFVILAFVSFVIYGLMFLFAGIDKSAADKARNGVQYSILALVVAFSAFIFIRLVTELLNGSF